MRSTLQTMNVAAASRNARRARWMPAIARAEQSTGVILIWSAKQQAFDPHAMGITRRSPLARHLVYGWLAILALGLSMQMQRSFALLDLKLLDQAYAALRRLGPPVPVSPDIAIVAIDDATFAAFPEPLALWHRHLGDILAALAQAQPKAVGLDIELPERSYDFVRPGGDLELLKGLLAMRTAAPLVLARGVDQAGRVKPIYAPFLAAVGDDGTGLATWPVDADGRVRRFDERLGENATVVPTFTGTIARRLGREPLPGLIDFTLGGPYTYLPAQSVVEWSGRGDIERLRSAFAGRVGLVGSVLPFADRHVLPVQLAGWEENNATPGVLIHAQALRSIFGPGLIGSAPALAPVLLVALASLTWFALARLGAGLSLLALFVLGVLGLWIWLLKSGIHLPIAAALATAGAGAAARVGYEAWFNRRERARLRSSFEGYVSPNVMEMILRGDLGTQTGTGRRMLCVLFADIRNFTPISERAQTEQVVTLLNLYFERMTRAIHAHDGTVDNFRGDGIMAIFGAPQPTPHPCRDGFLSAQGMLAEIDGLNDELAGRGIEPIAIGTSLAYGEAIVGHIGAAARHEYTAIGDVANVSARLESMTKEVGYPLVVSADVVSALQAEVQFDDLGVREIKGHASVHVYGWPPRGTHVPAGHATTAGEGHG